MKEKQIKKLINDSEKYLQKNNFEDYVLMYILKKVTCNMNDKFFAVACNESNKLFFEVYGKKAQFQFNYIKEESFDYDLFYHLEVNDCSILFITMTCHYVIWKNMQNISSKDITYQNGVKQYFNYCFDNNITKEVISKATGLEIHDVRSHDMREEYRQLQKVANTILNGRDAKDLSVAQDMLNEIWIIDKKEPALKRTQLQQLACDICALMRDHLPKIWREWRLSGDDETDVVKEVYNRLTSSEGIKTTMKLLQDLKTGKLPETDHKKIKNILLILEQYDRSDNISIHDKKDSNTVL